MCLAVPAKVISIDGAFAQVDFMGIQGKVYIELVRNVTVGEYVLVHAGCAIEKIDEAAFDYYSHLCRELAEV